MSNVLHSNTRVHCSRSIEATCSFSFPYLNPWISLLGTQNVIQLTLAQQLAVSGNCIAHYKALAPMQSEMTGFVKFIAAQLQHPLWTLLALLLLSSIVIIEQLSCKGSALVAYTVAGREICNPKGSMWALGGLLCFIALLQYMLHLKHQQLVHLNGVIAQMLQEDPNYKVSASTWHNTQIQMLYHNVALLLNKTVTFEGRIASAQRAMEVWVSVGKSLRQRVKELMSVVSGNPAKIAAQNDWAKWQLAYTATSFEGPSQNARMHLPAARFGLQQSQQAIASHSLGVTQLWSTYTDEHVMEHVINIQSLVTPEHVMCDFSGYDMEQPAAMDSENVPCGEEMC